MKMRARTEARSRYAIAGVPGAECVVVADVTSIAQICRMADQVNARSPTPPTTRDGSNTLEPGWVASKMGAAQKMEDFDAAHRTRPWLATRDDPAVKEIDGTYSHYRPRKPSNDGHDTQHQVLTLAECTRITVR